jgi:hypothetical protein
MGGRPLDIVEASPVKTRTCFQCGGRAVNIEIRDAALQARIQRQLQATGAASLEEVSLRLLETQEEQDRWLVENREAINAKIGRGLEQLDRGEGALKTDWMRTCRNSRPASGIVPTPPVE